MQYGPKVTTTIASATAGDYKNLNPVPRCAGAVGLLLRLWQNSTGAGDRTLDAVYAYPTGPDGTTIVTKGWVGGAGGPFGASLGGQPFALPKASAADTPPMGAALVFVPLMTGGVPCIWPSVIAALHFAGGSADATVLVAEAWPVYMDGAAGAGVGAVGSPF